MEVIDNTAIPENAPLPSYRPSVFGPIDVGRSRIAKFLDDGSCREWVLSRLHPDGPRCPGCGESITSYPSLRSFRMGARVRCCRCGKYFTALTGTFLSGCHLSFPQVVLMAILIDAGADDARIARLMEVSTEGVRGWRLRFQHAAKPSISSQGIRESRDGEKGGVVVAGEVSL